MALETYPLLRRLREGHFDSSVTITFNADLVFYEQVILATLRSRGCYNNFILMDLHQYEDSLQSGADHLSGLGCNYGLWPIAAPSAFHPKVVLLCGDRCGRLILGSGNLTVRGMSSNWEVFSETNHTSRAPNENLFRQVWAFILSITTGAGPSVARQIRQVEEASPWVLGEEDSSAWPRFLVGRPGGPVIAKQVANALEGQIVRRLVVVAPFFDRELGGLDVLEEALSPAKVSLVVQPNRVSLPGRALSRKAAHVYRFTPEEGRLSPHAYLHAKLYLIETDDQEYCLWGSPNCSLAALAPSADRGNFEVGLLARGPKWHFQNRLRLGPSLAKGARIHDPELLRLRETIPEPLGGRFRLTGVEFADGRLEATIASGSQAPQELAGLLRLTTRSRVVGQVVVERTTDGAYRGRWNPGTLDETVLARLVLGAGANTVESAPAAVHFHTLLALAAPSRRGAEVRRLLEGIRSGGESWAEGLETVCEIIFRLETTDAGKVGKVIMGRARDEVAKGNDEEGKEVAYEHFLTDPAPGDTTGSAPGSQSSLLLELLQLGPRLLAGVQVGSAMDDSGANRDSWRYQEEEQQDTAETGDVLPPDEASSPEQNFGLHRRLRQGYLSFMSTLAQRAEGIRDQKEVADRDELLRLHLVATLVLQAIGREVEGVRHLGPLLHAHDLEQELLPAIAILLGRSPKARREPERLDGPVLLRAGCRMDDFGSKDAGCMVAMLLSALVAHRKQQAAGRIEIARSLSDCLELIAARSFMTLDTLGALPSPDHLEQTIQSLRQGFPWLLSLGQSVGAAFTDLIHRGRRISQMEQGEKPELSPPHGVGLEPGVWVYTRACGVTEILGVHGEAISVAFIDGPGRDPLIQMSITWTNVRPTGMRRSC